MSLFVPSILAALLQGWWLGLSSLCIGCQASEPGFWRVLSEPVLEQWSHFCSYLPGSAVVAAIRIPAASVADVSSRIVAPLCANYAGLEEGLSKAVTLTATTMTSSRKMSRRTSPRSKLDFGRDAFIPFVESFEIRFS
mmetsp:Transcript_113594/g.284302  ORF Transcript_113594/g.284302 Transcript_113594/m.284302 type:complete len:138 (+) Transcript_113594:84-497(+)